MREYLGSIPLMWPLWCLWMWAREGQNYRDDRTEREREWADLWENLFRHNLQHTPDNCQRSIYIFHICKSNEFNVQVPAFGFPQARVKAPSASPEVNMYFLLFSNSDLWWNKEKKAYHWSEQSVASLNESTKCENYFKKGFYMKWKD